MTAKHIIPWALLAVITVGAVIFGVSTLGMPPERTTLYVLVILTGLSLLVVVLVYGLLTPWYRSRTGIGFMSTKVSFLTIITLTIINSLWFKIPTWASVAAWIFIIITINFGITWNILYKQFFEHRKDEMKDKSRSDSPQAGVHDTGISTGSIPHIKEHHHG